MDVVQTLLGLLGVALLVAEDLGEAKDGVEVLPVPLEEQRALLVRPALPVLLGESVLCRGGLGLGLRGLRSCPGADGRLGFGEFLGFGRLLLGPLLRFVQLLDLLVF